MSAKFFINSFKTTKKVVEFLTHHPKVEKVNHPSLPDHPDQYAWIGWK